MQNIDSSTLNPFLLFEFANQEGNVIPLHFEQPLKVITANVLEEVIPCLHQIQEAVKEGFYAAGYISYEAAPAFESSFRVHKDSKMPLLWFGIFNEPTSISARGNKDEIYAVKDWKPTVHGEEYHGGITMIKQAIENGDTYQVNYTTRLRSQFEGNDLAFYRKLSNAQSSQYSAYLNIGDYRILSASPELFFRWDGNEIITRPMKGTVKRGKTVEEDNEKANWLYHSEKNRAENLMIVDLLRNDLGSIAIPGSVKVDKLFDIERYPTVWQMTSTISAKTDPDVKLVDVFTALFPCGSITGAPKISTMDLIAKLEDTPREVYCGAIGYISPKGESIFNVPIRTVVIDNKTSDAEYGVGGGITWDSTTEDEYNEILAKASLLTVRIPKFNLLESLKLENGIYFLLDRHIKRLQQSAEFFGFKISVTKILKDLKEFAEQHQNGPIKVRLQVSKEGNIAITGEATKPFNAGLPVTIAKSPINKKDFFLYHKTTNRTIFDDIRNNHSDVFDVLLWNVDGEITEFTNGNVVLNLDGKLWTPSQSSGLLAGTFREELLEKGEIKERILTLEDLKLSTGLWLINSVREWVKVALIGK